MKKTSDKSAGNSKGALKRPSCFMAYTLNNSQPVICTLVSDQPYFYMEEDDHYAGDDALLTDEEYGQIEKDLSDLRQKMEAYERLSKSFEKDPSRRLEEFAAEAINLTEANSVVSLSSENVSEKISAMLGHTRMGNALLEFATSHNVFIQESPYVMGAQYDRESSNIFVNPSLADAETALLVVRELRRHWQHRKGTLIHPLSFYPDQAILINRAQNADLAIAMIRAGWEMQLSGHRQAWDYIENSPMSDLGRAFAREAFSDFRSLANGKASSAVFESWFLSERCRHQDKKLIQAMLADHQGYVFSSEEASRSVSIELVTALGEQPFGKNYLAPYAQMIVTDPIFTEVRDRSNANFLWFIKFERSFQETEQALQSEGYLGSDDPSASAPHKKAGTERLSNDQDFTLISLADHRFIHRDKTGRNSVMLEEEAGRTNVIHVRFGNADA